MKPRSLFESLAAGAFLGACTVACIVAPVSPHVNPTVGLAIASVIAGSVITALGWISIMSHPGALKQHFKTMHDQASTREDWHSVCHCQADEIEELARRAMTLHTSVETYEAAVRAEAVEIIDLARVKGATIIEEAYKAAHVIKKNAVEDSCKAG